MDQREPPYLQFGFYFDHLSGDEAIMHIFDRLLPDGNPIQAAIQDLEEKRTRWMEPLVPGYYKYIDADAEDIRRLQLNDVVRIAAIDMECSPLHASRRILLKQRWETDSPQFRSRPVEIIIDANDFCGTPDISKTKLPTDLNRLEWLLERLSPTYVTITVEYPTTSPSELYGRKSPYHGFDDCYLSRELAERVLPAVASQLPSHGCMKKLKSGTLICTSGSFLPEGCSRYTPDPSITKRVSATVAEKIVEYFYGPQKSKGT